MQCVDIVGGFFVEGEVFVDDDFYYMQVFDEQFMDEVIWCEFYEIGGEWYYQEYFDV